MTPPNTSSSATTIGRFSDQHAQTELGRAQQRAAQIYGVDHAAFMVHGATAAIAIALRAHHMSRGRLNVLVAHGAHRSVVSQVLAIGGATLRFLRSDLDARYEAWLPPSPSQIEEALRTNPNVDLIVIESPTPAGFHARVTEIARVAHAHGALLHVAAAGGALMGFHPSLPASPVACGADSASTSISSRGRAWCTQSGLFTWSEQHLDGRAIRCAHAEYFCEEPSYIIAASIAEAIERLETSGSQAIERTIRLKRQLAARINSALPALETLEPTPITDRFRDDPSLATDPSSPLDPMRLTIGLAAYHTSGFDVAARLVSVGVVPDSAGVNAVSMIVPIDAAGDLPKRVAGAIVDQLAGRQRSADLRARVLPNPLVGLGEPDLDPHLALAHSLVTSESVPIHQAAGRLCLELLATRPAGIPIGVPGFRLTRRAIDYLEAVHEAHGHVVSLTPGEVLVLPEDESSTNGINPPSDNGHSGAVSQRVTAMDRWRSASGPLQSALPSL